MSGRDWSSVEAGEMVTCATEAFVQEITPFISAGNEARFAEADASISMLREPGNVLTCDLNTYFEHVLRLRGFVRSQFLVHFDELFASLKGSVKVWSDDAGDFVQVFR